ncbi:MAG TPA: TraR/DksA C4-type zinc finger protein [Phycisphaerales bacterium]|nr:TraR/DksA C4-type zinc finger protein [Phycisphaerales bacterium]HMP37379.1 TraR/DksA C4-type zinc finger protein [Phycisphaerales bacterium]
MTAAKAGAKAKPAAAKDAKLASSAKSAASGSARRGKVDLSSPRSVAAAATAGTTDAQGYVVINGRRVRMISTKDIKVAKKPRSAEAKSEAAAAGPDIASIKTRLSKKELDQYRQLLLSRRADILGLVQGMEQEALRSEGGNLSHMPIHMADIGSDTADQDFALNLAEKERQTITEIDAALQRISDGSYGVCQATGKPIPKARLDAKPWAKYTIEAARMVESGHRF